MPVVDPPYSFSTQEVPPERVSALKRISSDEDLFKVSLSIPSANALLSIPSNNVFWWEENPSFPKLDGQFLGFWDFTHLQIRKSALQKVVEEEDPF